MFEHPLLSTSAEGKILSTNLNADLIGWQGIELLNGSLSDTESAASALKYFEERNFQAVLLTALSFFGGVCGSGGSAIYFTLQERAFISPENFLATVSLFVIGGLSAWRFTTYFNSSDVCLSVIHKLHQEMMAPALGRAE